MADPALVNQLAASLLAAHFPDSYFLYYPPLSLQLVGVEQRRLPDATGLGYLWDIGYIFTNKPVPYGHLGFYYHAVKAGEGAAGYYMVLRPPMN